WIANPFNGTKKPENSENLSATTIENDLFIFMYKQKRRQNELRRQMEKLTDLVRLIIQKMNISSTETDLNDYDRPTKMPVNWSKLRRTMKAANNFKSFIRPTSSSKVVDDDENDDN
ncbi:unnamed protein product, partial [Didymodactylos carnosus]